MKGAAMRDYDQVLRWGTAVFAAAFVAHNLDHLRRGVDSATGQVKAGGAVLSVLAVLAIARVVTRHRHAPATALVVGLLTAALVTAAHLLPDWGAFSDSLPDGDVDALTWAAAVAETVGGLVLAGAAAYTLRRQPTSTVIA